MPHNSVSILKPVPEYLAKFNCKTKFYPGFSKSTVFNKSVYNPHGLEEIKDRKKFHNKTNNEKRVDRPDNIKRAKDKAYDICYANRFDYFITFTLDSAKIDRYDRKDILRKINIWLNNSVRRKNFKYIIFPEYHKDKAIHFHGLCSGNLALTDSGLITKKGQKIYNSGAWKYGFSTVIKLEGPYERVINYVVKYITKEEHRVFGKYYLSGGKDIKREVPTVYSNVEFYSIDSKSYIIEGTGLEVKYLTYYDT